MLFPLDDGRIKRLEFESVRVEISGAYDLFAIVSVAKVLLDRDGYR